MTLAELIQRLAVARGYSPDWALAVAQRESSMNPAATNGSYQGLYQFGPAAWKQYGSGNIMDPQANATAFFNYADANKRYLASKIGREPTPGELYAAHQQGPGAAVSLINNPNDPATSLVSQRNLVANRIPTDTNGAGVLDHITAFLGSPEGQAKVAQAKASGFVPADNTPAGQEDAANFAYARPTAETFRALDKITAATPAKDIFGDPLTKLAFGAMAAGQPQAQPRPAPQPVPITRGKRIPLPFPGFLGGGL